VLREEVTCMKRKRELGFPHFDFKELTTSILLSRRVSGNTRGPLTIKRERLTSYSVKEEAA